jgi:DNA-directed RNA polymerase alpha subunit
MTQIVEVRLDILDKPITSLILSKRVMTCLKNENITTLRDLVKSSEEELKRLPKFGPGSWKELTDRLATVGIVLKKYAPRKPPKPLTARFLPAEWY